MPTISWFFGISIRMFLNDHPPPHFHAYYGTSCAQIDIRTGEVRVGRLPPKIARLVERWRRRYTAELMACWERAVAGESGSLGRIPGLDEG